MGLGYAMWEETHNINASIATGNIDSQITNVSAISENGEISLHVLENNKKLSIEGLYYPNSIIDIIIGVENKGSVPVVLNNSKSGSSMSSNTGISNLFELSDEEFIISVQSDRESTSLYTYEIQEQEEGIQVDTTSSINNSVEDYIEYENSSYLSNILACQAEIQSIQDAINRTQDNISKLEKLVKEAKNLEEQHSFYHSIQYIQAY